MLDRPEMTEAFAGQLRQVLNAQAEYVAKIRRDAEAMWKANRPEGYSSFEAWWRHRWVTSPFAAIQDHIEQAAKLTFQLEARYRQGRHEIPAARQAAALEKKRAKQGVPAVTAGPATAAPQQAVGPAQAATGGDFLGLIRKESA